MEDTSSEDLNPAISLVLLIGNGMNKHSTQKAGIIKQRKKQFSYMVFTGDTLYASTRIG